MGLRFFSSVLQLEEETETGLLAFGLFKGVAQCPTEAEETQVPENRALNCSHVRRLYGSAVHPGSKGRSQDMQPELGG